MLTMTRSIQAYIDAMVEDIKAAAPKDTGALRSSITSTVTLDSNGYEVGISMLDYGSFIDKGVNGIGPGTPNAKHSVVKGSPYSFRGMIATSPFAKYTSSLSGQFAIARSIAQNGIVARNFIEPNLDKKLEGLANLTMEEIWSEFERQEEEKNKK